MAAPMSSSYTDRANSVNPYSATPVGIATRPMFANSVGIFDLRKYERVVTTAMRNDEE